MLVKLGFKLKLASTKHVDADEDKLENCKTKMHSAESQHLEDQDFIYCFLCLSV